MDIESLILKKNNKQVLTKKEIQFFIDNYCNNKITEEQAVRFIKAIYDNGLNLNETTNLTLSMARSGEVVDLSSVGECVDKHSTGGVSDTTTLVIVPVLASLGVKVAKMSGRSLGFTGGTADKVEVFDGYNNNITIDEFKNNIKNIGASLISQSEKIAIADKKIYALRDRTGLVDNISLIASSVMSKKIACGAKILLLDVKYGNGAFMSNVSDAKKLAKTMVKIGNKAGIKTCAIISNMNEPLTNYVGNNLEVYSALQVLKGKDDNLSKLCKIIVATILKVMNKVDCLEKGVEMAEKVLKNEKALIKFKQLIENQGGSIDKIENDNILLQSKNNVIIRAENSGYLTSINCKELGLIVHEISKKEKCKQDKNCVGVKILVDKNNFIKKGDNLAVLNYVDANVNKCLKKLKDCFIITKSKSKSLKLIEEIIM